MPLITAGRIVCGTLAALFLTGPVLAEGGHGHERVVRHHSSAKRLPLDIRYRDSRYVAPPRQARRFGSPDFLIHAYLPRTTETPIYNEPPSRFLSR